MFLLQKQVSIGDNVNKMVAVAMVMDTSAWGGAFEFPSLDQYGRINNFVSDVFHIQRFGELCAYPTTCESMSVELYLPDLPQGSLTNLHVFYPATGSYGVIDSTNSFSQ